jgi:hypothetical protein
MRYTGAFQDQMHTDRDVAPSVRADKKARREAGLFKRSDV